MPAGLPITDTDIDNYLEAMLSADAALQSYLPYNNGESYWRERPPADYTMPVVRWWRRIDGIDTELQDGKAGRAMSNPEYIVCVLDRQNAEQIDRQFGSYGIKVTPPQPYLDLAVKRIYSILHAKTYVDANGTTFTAFVIKNYTGRDPVKTGTYEVGVGYVFQLRVS